MQRDCEAFRKKIGNRAPSNEKDNITDIVNYISLKIDEIQQNTTLSAVEDRVLIAYNELSLEVYSQSISEKAFSALYEGIKGIAKSKKDESIYIRNLLRTYIYYGKKDLSAELISSIIDVLKEWKTKEGVKDDDIEHYYTGLINKGISSKDSEKAFSVLYEGIEDLAKSEKDESIYIRNLLHTYIYYEKNDLSAELISSIIDVLKEWKTKEGVKDDDIDNYYTGLINKGISSKDSEKAFSVLYEGIEDLAKSEKDESIYIRNLLYTYIYYGKNDLSAKLISSIIDVLKEWKTKEGVKDDDIDNYYTGLIKKGISSKDSEKALSVLYEGLEGLKISEQRKDVLYKYLSSEKLKKNEEYGNR